MQVANVMHMVAAYLSIALACVHTYLGTIGMEGAYRAMRYGYVDASLGGAPSSAAGTRKSPRASRRRNSSCRGMPPEAERVAPRTKPA